jgi:hypothetical protein
MRCKEFCRDEVLARTHEAFRAIRKPSICQVKPFEALIKQVVRAACADAQELPCHLLSRKRDSLHLVPDCR